MFIKKKKKNEKILVRYRGKENECKWEIAPAALLRLFLKRELRSSKKTKKKRKGKNKIEKTGYRKTTT